MQIPVQITFRDIPGSAAVEDNIREHAAKLERFFDRVTRCRVVVEAPHRHHHQGKLYHVRVDLTVPGSELVVNREPHEHHAHEDVYVAIRDAFLAAGRQLEEFARKHRHHVKTHEEAPAARVVRLFADQGYGFVATSDGREIYFHKNSVVDGGFTNLAVGTEVRVVVAEGESINGPQASTVQVIA